MLIYKKYKQTSTKLNDYPVFIVIKDNKVCFLSKNYAFGIGEQIIKVIQSTKSKSKKEIISH